MKNASSVDNLSYVGFVILVMITLVSLRSASGSVVSAKIGRLPLTESIVLPLQMHPR